MRRVPRLVCFSAFAALALGLLLAGCGNKESKQYGASVVSYPLASPSGAASEDLPRRPGDQVEVDVALGDGLLGRDQVSLPAGKRSIINVRNADNQSYTPQVGNLIPAAAIPAMTITRIEIDAPNGGEVEARLFGTDLTKPLDSMRIVFESNGSATPGGSATP